MTTPGENENQSTRTTQAPVMPEQSADDIALQNMDNGGDMPITLEPLNNSGTGGGRSA